MSQNTYFFYDSGYLEESIGDEMAFSQSPKVQIVVKSEFKNETLSEDDDEIGCRLCNKTFANSMALSNHARVAHIEAYQTGNPDVWTQTIQKTEQPVNPKLLKIKSDLISVKPTLLHSLATSDYIIVKSEDAPVKKKKADEPKKSPKRSKTVQVITGPFECVEPSTVGSDGTCHQMFFSCCEYSAHVRSEHARRRRAARCQVCERILPPVASDNTAPYVCLTCGEGFTSEESLMEHSETHVKMKKYECGVCHKRFTQQGGVQQHMRMHTGDRPYPCTICPKAFTQKSGLEQHLRTHTKIKPYRCIVCTKSFCQSVHLKQHMRTHTNLAPFQCGICDKRFKQSSHLNYHLKNHNPANMSQEQRDKYNQLIGQIKSNTNEDETIEMETVEDSSFMVTEPFVYIEDRPTEVLHYEE